MFLPSVCLLVSVCVFETSFFAVGSVRNSEFRQNTDIAAREFSDFVSLSSPLRSAGMNERWRTFLAEVWFLENLRCFEPKFVAMMANSQQVQTYVVIV